MTIRQNVRAGRARQPPSVQSRISIQNKAMIPRTPPAARARSPNRGRRHDRRRFACHAGRRKRRIRGTNAMNPFARPAAKPAAKPSRPPAARPSPKPIDDIADLAVGARVILPWPPAILSPNARANHWRLASAKKTYRLACFAATCSQLGVDGRRMPDDGPIRLHLDFFPPDRRRRDDDNAIASFKSGRDGVADALKSDDSRFVTSHRWRADPRSCVVVTILAAA